MRASAKQEGTAARKSGEIEGSTPAKCSWLASKVSEAGRGGRKAEAVDISEDEGIVWPGCLIAHQCLQACARAH